MITEKREGKEARYVLSKCVGGTEEDANQDGTEKLSIALQGRDKWHIDVCYGSDFLAQKSRLATISSPTSSSYAYKI